MRVINFKAIKIRKLEAPFLAWIVIGSTFIADTIEFPILGRNISGWAWVIPFIFSLYIILGRLSQITFPISTWLPWLCVVIGYSFLSGLSSLQRSIILVCPVIVGIAISTNRVREIQLRGFLELIRLLVLTLFITVIIRTGLLFTGVLPSATGLAPQSMTAALLCSIFAVEYSVNRKSSLFRWIIGVVIPAIALTRMAITAAGITIPFTFASLRIKKRVIFLTIVVLLGVAFFYTERMQKKMFFSGRGSIEDVRFGNPDFFTAGRSRLWDLMIDEIKQKPLWGHGGNASEEFVLSATWGMLTHPHNDWLRLLYDYGLVGSLVFAFCLVAQVIHLLKRAKRTFGESRVLLYAGASSFLPFVLLMSTDNIILYAAFFGNLQFTIIGLVYAAQRTQEIDAWYYYHASPANGRPNVSSYDSNNSSNQKSHDLRT